MNKAIEVANQVSAIILADRILYGNIRESYKRCGKINKHVLVKIMAHNCIDYKNVNLNLGTLARTRIELTVWTDVFKGDTNVPPLIALTKRGIQKLGINATVEAPVLPGPSVLPTKSETTIEETPMKTPLDYSKPVEKVVRVFGYEITKATDELLIEMIREATEYIHRNQDIANLSKKVADQLSEVQVGIDLLVKQLDNN